MEILNGFSAESLKSFQLDAGMLLVGLDFSTVTDDKTLASLITSAKADDSKKLGVTSGGGSFEIIPEWRDLTENADGAMGKYMNGMAVNRIDCKLSTTLMEVNDKNLAMAIGVADVSALGTGKKITGRYTVKDSDYLKNVCWAGSINKDGGLLVIEFKNAMNTNGLTFDFKNKDNGTYSIEIEPFIDLTALDETPWNIYII